MSFVNLFNQAYKKIYRNLNPSALDLLGDRELEWFYITGHIPDPPGTALDFGCGDFPVGLAAGLKGYQVTAIDLKIPRWNFVHRNIKFIRADFLMHNFNQVPFDLILNCSTIEHVGLTGRYESAENPDGDLQAMQKLWRLLKPGGKMLMTIPVGRDKVCFPLHRIYGSERLPQLTHGFHFLDEQYWLKRPGKNTWVQADRHEALRIEGGPAFYSLGMFCLSRPHENSDT